MILLAQRRAAWGAALLAACGSSSDPSPFQGARLEVCNVTLANRADVRLDFVELAPTDFVGVYADLADVIVEPGAEASFSSAVGEYQLRAYNSEFLRFYTSAGHVCAPSEDLSIVVRESDWARGVLQIENRSSSELTSFLVASTDDRIWSEQMLPQVIPAGGSAELDVGEGRFYWSALDGDGASYFGSTRTFGSSNGLATVSEDSAVEPGICTLRLTNRSSEGLQSIVVHDSSGWASNTEVLDSRDPLPDGESLDVLIPTGDWQLSAVAESGVQLDVRGLRCEDGAPLSATVE